MTLDEVHFITRHIPLLLILWAAALLTSCATPMNASDLPRHLLRLETCLANVAHLDPGPIDGVADAQLQAALQTYVAQFAQDDIMAMGRDPQSAEVERAAFRALLYRCWREDKLPPTDPLRQTPPPPPL
jgi:hypothetical protein